MFRKLLLTFLFFSICSNAHAITQQYLCASGGTWSGSVWVLTTGAQGACTGGSTPVTGDEATLNATSGNVTVAASTSTAGILMTGYTGTMTINTGDTLTISAGDLATLVSDIEGPGTLATSTGGITLGGNVASTTKATITVTGAETLTSAGFTWGGNMTISEAGSVTLATSSTWNNLGLTTISAATLLTPSSATLNTNGGLTVSSNMSSSSVAVINISGGTWSGTGNVYGPLTLGSIALGSGGLYYNGTALTFTSSSTITGAYSVYINGNLTITPNSVSFPGNIICYSNNATITLASALTTTGTIEVGGGNTLTFSGAYNVSMSALEIDGVAPYGSTITLVAGQTYTVTTALYLNGGTGVNYVSTATVQSSSGSATAALDYTGTQANAAVYGITFTRIDASGSSNPIYDYYAGTLTTVTNISSQNASNIGGTTTVQGLFIQ